MLDQVPPEVLARIFEIGILASDISYLPPLCRVCKTWNYIVRTTPCLWGIISIHRGSNQRILDQQITRAKESPLAIHVDPRLKPDTFIETFSRLASLANNWVYADLRTNVLALASWSDMKWSLQELRLASSPDLYDEIAVAGTFFGEERELSKRPTKLRSFAAHGLPRVWILPFLSPAIENFEFRAFRDFGTPLSEILAYLSAIPKVFTVRLIGLNPPDFTDLTGAVHLLNLLTFELSSARHPAILLSQIRAPALQTFSMHGAEGWSASNNTPSMGFFFSQWSQPDFLPEHLHTLELCECLTLADVPYLIRWLARLPSLVRLIIRDDAVGEAASSLPREEETNLFKALASPCGARPLRDDWLCPKLAELYLATDVEVTYLIPIAKARGRIAAPPSTESAGRPPARLRTIEAMLCPSGSAKEIEELTALVDRVYCGCLGCYFELAVVT